MLVNAMNGKISLSVLVPVYNEQYLVGTTLDRLKVLASSDLLKRVEIIEVDDGSSDATGSVLRDFEGRLRAEDANGQSSKISWKTCAISAIRAKVLRSGLPWLTQPATSV